MSTTDMVFDAMEAKDWEKVKEIVITTSWTPIDLEKTHGVRYLNRFLSAL
jgi:hypothetical protein